MFGRFANILTYQWQESPRNTRRSQPAGLVGFMVVECRRIDTGMRLFRDPIATVRQGYLACVRRPSGWRLDHSWIIPRLHMHQFSYATQRIEARISPEQVLDEGYARNALASSAMICGYLTTEICPLTALPHSGAVDLVQLGLMVAAVDRRGRCVLLPLGSQFCRHSCCWSRCCD